MFPVGTVVSGEDLMNKLRNFANVEAVYISAVVDGEKRLVNSNNNGAKVLTVKDFLKAEDFEAYFANVKQ